MIILSIIKAFYVLIFLWLGFVYLNSRYLWVPDAVFWMPLLTDSDGVPYNSSVPAAFGPFTFMLWSTRGSALTPTELKVSVFDGNACQGDIPQLSGLVLPTVTGNCSKGDQVLNLQQNGAKAVVFEHLASEPLYVETDKENDESIRIPAMLLDSVDFDHLKHSENASIKFKNVKLPTGALLVYLGVGVLYKAIAWGHFYWARRNYKEIKEKDFA